MGQPDTSSSRDTKEKILDSAERLFADRGFAATSMRAITTGAEVNLAAVNYHFGSKDALIEAVFVRRIGPLNAERLERLDALEAAGSPALEPIVEAFVGPALRMGRDTSRGGPVFMRLLGHAISEPSVCTMFTHQFREVFARFTKALQRTLDDLTSEELIWRFLFMVGAMAYTMAMTDEIEQISAGVCDAGDVDATIRRLVPFLAAGLAARATEAS